MSQRLFKMQQILNRKFSITSIAFRAIYPINSVTFKTIEKFHHHQFTLITKCHAAQATPYFWCLGANQSFNWAQYHRNPLETRQQTCVYYAIWRPRSANQESPPNPEAALELSFDYGSRHLEQLHYMYTRNVVCAFRLGSAAWTVAPHKSTRKNEVYTSIW